MNIEVYYLVEQIEDKTQFVSGPYPHYPAAALALREAKYKVLNGERFRIVSHNLNVEEL